MPKSESEIDSEKASKPRPDLIPAISILRCGEVMAYGYQKHGNCTWKNAGTEQAKPETHVASALRHLLEHIDNPAALEEGSGKPVLWHAMAQLSIAIACVEAQKPVRDVGIGQARIGIYCPECRGSGIRTCAACDGHGTLPSPGCP